VDDGCAAGRKEAGLLGGRELCCWTGDRREKAVLLGADDKCAAGWKGAGLLRGGGLLGGRGLCCWAVERWTTGWEGRREIGGELLSGK
jgi:hypothetical protein